MLNPRQSQRGRSLVELIAVMAIMAMLAGISIGWLRGAIVRQEADRDYEDIQLFISAVRNQGTLRTDKGMADAFLSYKKTRSGKDLCKLDNCPQNTKGMTIRLDDIDDKTCERLMKKKWDGPFKPLLFLRAESGQNVYSWNGTDGAGLYRLNTSADCVKNGAPEQGAFAVVFNDKRDSVVSCTEGTECGECEYCSAKGICENACTEGQTCAREFETPGTPKECYPTDHIVDGVYCAYPDGNGNCCDNKGQNCCPPDKPIMGKNGMCYGCDENVIIEVQKATGIKNCGRCDNRNYRDAKYNNIGWCLPNECPTDKPVMDVKGVCHACEERAQMKAWTRSDTGDLSSCETCTENGILDNLFCTPCPNGMTNENGVCMCPSGQMVGHVSKMSGDRWSQLQCYSCGTDNLNTIIFWRSNTNACQEQCPDRTTVLVNEQSSGYAYSFCALTTCPDGYMHDKWGTCKSCTQSADINFQPSSLTNSCSECGGMRYTDGNNCKRCPADISSLTLEQQAECTPVGENNSCGENPCIVYDEESKTCQNKCTKVEYLQGTGTQWIDTGYNMSNIRKIDLEVDWSAHTTSRREIMGSATSGGYLFEVGITGYYGVGISNYSNILAKNKDLISWQWDGENTYPKLYINETLACTDTLLRIPVGTFKTAISNGYATNSKIYWLKVYTTSNQKVRDFIPVLDANGVPAMYDQVEKKLYYNAGTGTFSYGPVVN